METSIALRAVKSNHPFPGPNTKEFTVSDDINPWPELIKLVEPLKLDI